MRLQPSARRPGARPVVRRFGLAPVARVTGLAFGSQARPSTPTESSSPRRPARDRLCFGRVVPVPVLSTPPCGDAVPVRYRTALHRTGADLHRSIPSPSQAHGRGRLGRSGPRPRGPHRARGEQMVGAWRSVRVQREGALNHSRAGCAPPRSTASFRIGSPELFTSSGGVFPITAP